MRCNPFPDREMGKTACIEQPPGPLAGKPRNSQYLGAARLEPALQPRSHKLLLELLRTVRQRDHPRASHSGPHRASSFGQSVL